MKFQKRIDPDNHLDIYVLYLGHEEATEAFKAMNPAERIQIHALQRSEQVSTLLKTLTLWAQKIEETKEKPGRKGRRPHYEG